MNDGLHVIIKFAEKLNQYFQDFKTSYIFLIPMMLMLYKRHWKIIVFRSQRKVKQKKNML